MKHLTKEEIVVAEEFVNKYGEYYTHKNYEIGDSRPLCDYIVFRNFPSRHERDICHAKVSSGSYSGGNKIRGVGNSVRFGNEPEFLRWYNYILDPIESPWRQCLHGCQTVQNRDCRVNGFLFYTGEIPSLVSCNLLIASRVPWEHPEYNKTWIRLCDLGLNKTVAYYLSNIVSAECHPIQPAKHSALPSNCFNNFVSLCYLFDGGKFKTQDLYDYASPMCNSIWENETEKSFKTYLDKDLGKIKSLQDLSKLANDKLGDYLEQR